MQPIVYVCVVSKFNVAEFEACLTRKPQRVALIVSDGEAFSVAAHRLRESLKTHLSAPEHHIDLLDSQHTGQPLSGDDVLECQHWVQAVLQPYLERPDIAPLQHCLNFTGGTKAMSLALTTGYPWDLMDYKSSNRAELQVLKPLFKEGLPLKLVIETPLPLQEAALLDVARLYADNPYLERQNPLIDHPNSAALAAKLWQALQDKDPDLLRLFKGFEHIWAKGRQHPDYNKKQLELDWPQFLGSDQPPSAGVLDWLSQLQSLSLEASSLSATEQLLGIPGNNPKGLGKDWRNWICGDWLEQQVYLWLREAGIPDSAIARNLKVADQSNRNGSQRETDLMIHYRGSTHLIEVKADLPPNEKLTHLEEQLSSLGERFGMTQKILFIGPQLWHYLQEKAERWQSFELRCKASRVVLCSTVEALRSQLIPQRKS